MAQQDAQAAQELQLRQNQLLGHSQEAAAKLQADREEAAARIEQAKADWRAGRLGEVAGDPERQRQQLGKLDVGQLRRRAEVAPEAGQHARQRAMRQTPAPGAGPDAAPASA